MIRKPKNYHCPHCGVEIPLADFGFRSERMACRECVNGFLRWQVVQRQGADADIGMPPTGVRVEAGVVSPDSPHADRIVYSRRNLGLLLVYFWFFCFFGSLGVVALLRSGWIGIAGVALGLFGLAKVAARMENEE